MANVDDMEHAMRTAFTDNVDIPSDYEYLSDDELSEAVGVELDGYGFGSEQYLLYVDCRGLPEEFALVVLERGEGEVERHTTHESMEAATIAAELMNTY